MHEPLKNCPFCGEAAKHSFNSLYGDMSMASCKSCGATAYAPKWNRRAVLAKWGQPSGAGEAAEHYRNAIASACEGWTMPDGLRKHLETALWSLPTQAQAGEVPLTCEWTHNEDDGFWETACGEAWRFDDGGPGENNMHFCHSCGNSLRIKGGQHVS